MRELIVDNKQVDIDEKTKISLQIKSFLFCGIKELEGNRSWTVSLPLTENNRSIIDHCHLVDYEGKFPYKVYNASYYSGGFEVIKDGKAVLLRISDRAEFCITFGTEAEMMRKLSKTKLVDLLVEPQVDWLNWNTLVPFNDMTKGIGFCNWYNYTNKDRSLSAPNANLPAIATYPTVTLWRLYEKIASQIIGSIDSDLMTELKSAQIGIPIKDEFSGNYQITEERMSYNGPLPISLVGTQKHIVVQEGNKIACRYYGYMAMANCSWRVEIESSDRIQAPIVNLMADGGQGEVFQLIADTGIFFSYESQFEPDFDAESQLYRYELAISGDVSKINNVNIVFTGSSSRPSESQFGSTTQGYFDIYGVLPDITCSELMQEIMRLTGKFPMYIGGILLFKSANTLYDSIGSAYDWSDKLIYTGINSRYPSEISFKYGNYAEHNIMKYKDGEADPIESAGDITTNSSNNDTYEAVLFEMKFAQGNTVSNVDKTLDYVLNDISLVSSSNTPAYIKKDRVDHSDFVLARIDTSNPQQYTLKVDNAILMSEIVKKSAYVSYQKLIAEPRIIKDKFLLKPNDIAGINTSIPVYLSQYGKYYAILTIQYSESGISEVELLELK